MSLNLSHLILFLKWLLCVALTFMVVSCGNLSAAEAEDDAEAAAAAPAKSDDEFPPYNGIPERDAFWKRYNAQVVKELDAKMARLRTELKDAPPAPAPPPVQAPPAKKDKKPAAASAPVPAIAPDQWASLREELAKAELRRQKPGFFTFATPADLPAGLTWEDGMAEPEVGDGKAKKGGAFRTFIPSFPPTVRNMGGNSNNFFRSYHYDEVEMGLIALHPDTGQIIPALAQSWAVSPDNRTVYFKINPEAKYSDGTPVESDDWFQTFYMQLSSYSKNPYGNQYFSEEFANITRYDARTLSISMPDGKPLAPYQVNITPFPRHFYQEFGPDYEERYQWRPRPTAGPYTLTREGIQFGRSIALDRVKNWWAKDKKYYKNRFNVDQTIHRVIRTPEKAFELFRNNILDAYPLDVPDYWYERSEISAVQNGYIHKAKFYNIYPQGANGLYLNLAKPLLANLDIRLGLHHATNYQKVADYDLRGDFTRLNSFSDGYTGLVNPALRAREFSVEKALAAFAKAGFTKRGPDGILVNDKGERLSFTITFAKTATRGKIVGRLKEEAAKAGVEYIPEGLDGTEAFKKASEKKHDIILVAWGASPPFNDHYQHFHSKDAFLEDGKTPRPNTNNLNTYANPRMDAFAEGERKARTMEEYRAASFGADQLLHDDAVWIPGIGSAFYRMGYWRWVCWPERTFNVKISQHAFEGHVHWIDLDIKAETEKAMAEKRLLPEVNATHDLYRDGGASAAKP